MSKETKPDPELLAIVEQAMVDEKRIARNAFHEHCMNQKRNPLSISYGPSGYLARDTQIAWEGWWACWNYRNTHK